LTLEKLNCLYNKGKHEFQEELDNLDELIRELLLEKKLVEEDAELDFV